MHLNGKIVKIGFEGQTLAGNGQMDRIFMFMRKFCPHRVACPCSRAIYMYVTIISSPKPLGSKGELIVYPGSVVVAVVVHTFQSSSSLKPLGQLNSKFMWSILRIGERKFI